MTLSSEIGEGGGQPGRGQVGVDELALLDVRAPEGSTEALVATAATQALADRGLRSWIGWALRHGVGPFLVAVDVAALLLAAWITNDLAGRTVILLAILIGLNAAARLYSSRLTLSVLDDLPSLLGRGLAAAAITTSVGLLVDHRLATGVVIGTAALYVPFVLAFRAVGYSVARAVRRHRLIVHSTLVLGAGEVGGQLTQLMLDHPEYGLLPVGFLDDDPLLPQDRRPVPVLGGVANLAEVIAEFGVTQVLIAFGAVREASMIDILRTCDRLSCEIFFVPRLFEVSCVGGDMDQLWGVPLVRLRRAAFRTRAWHLKRAVDVIASAAALILLSPVYLVCALAVRLETGRGVLFRQQRVGLDGRAFDILKFRSMRPATVEESATQWSIAQDQRVGTFGRFLRKTSLDELPQLWNVLRGDMSLVGPRPERPHFVAEFDRTFPRYMARHRVPAGLTGWAQVHGLRGDTSIEDRARFDNCYVENWSLWFDLKVVIRTLGSLIRHTGR